MGDGDDDLGNGADDGRVRGEPGDRAPRDGVLAVGGASGGRGGGFAAAWIAVQLLILRRCFFLQPVIAGIGAAEVLLA